MPELPEVETIRRDLATCILRKEICAIKILNPKTVQNEAVFFIKSLVGKKFVDIGRRGKLLYLKISPSSKLKNKKSSMYLLIHLKMTGQLIYDNLKDKVVGGHSLSSDSISQAIGGALPNRHTRLFFKFNDKSLLYFNDLRKFGYLKIVNSEELEKILKNNYGPEPLTKEFTFSVFAGLLEGKKTKIKTLLLDQKSIAGLGNIYVDESLFAAKISPLRLAGQIKSSEAKKLFQSINQIIKQAIESCGTTFNNYVDAKGRKGRFALKLKVYGRKGLPCFYCHKPLVRIKLTGRGTHYCSNCQK